MPLRRLFPAAAAATAIALGAPTLHAQLREDQVLVVYDSRIPDSVAVAEYYAGSAKVTGATGSFPGVRPGVRTMNLNAFGGGFASPVADVSLATYNAQVRGPLRSFLNANSLQRKVRCLVLTKGLPHRVRDFSSATLGDIPNDAGLAAVNGRATFASVDSELTLLWQPMEANEAGNALDSRLDGLIVNPYWGQAAPVDAWSTRYLTSLKGFAVATTASLGWLTLYARLPDPPSIPESARFDPGTMYLVCRLDGHSVADVRAMIDRAQNLRVDTQAAVFVIDESESEGVQDLDNDAEFDNDGPTTGPGTINGGDDYEQTRDLLLADGRFNPANIRYNAASGPSEFLAGPNAGFAGGTTVHGPVLLLTTYGSNHQPIGGGGVPAGAAVQYASSFTYAPGAVFNTMESYNGRDFNGLGLGPVPQEQLADFIAAGGTFGVGNVWEPLAPTVADSAVIAQNFFLGHLSWAEAAYTALPGLSWQQIVVGDPLARVVRANEDLNADARTDAEDLYRWYESAARPDYNRDGVANATDARVLERAARAHEQVNMKRKDRLE